ncbi:MAG: efflux RND transporter periplasmic adaptor subunit, partial [bacterium]
QQNLAYTNIYAPIDGVVVERDMDVGQTVAASLSAPKLFVIANDLSQMQILANVDESDIGLITTGQPVSFSVQSYKDRQFSGAVRQVRLNSTTVNNVVSYTAIISVKNEDGKLLPGMTATAKFITGSAENVLTVPNAALRFAPPVVVSAETTPASGAAITGAPTGQQGMRRPPGAAGGAPGSVKRGTIYTVDASGALTKHRVAVGLSDGTRTQVETAELAAGSAIVLGTNVAGATAATATKNPLQPAPAGGGRGGPPGGF